MNYIPPVDFSDLQDLLCNAEDALEEEQYVTAIHKADKAHEELRKVYLDILNIKIKGHLGQGRLAIALNYAETLIKEFPDYIPGFEFIVDILIKQEKLHKAIDMCDNLITRRRVGKRRYWWDDDADYETLFRLKEYAIQRLNSRCDFMKQLPLDVIALIFDGFSFDMISICMDVSSHWRETLIRTPITNRLHNWNYSLDCDRIGSIQSIQLLGKYLKGLDVRILNSVPEYVHKKQKDLFQKVSFCQLRSLSISGSKINELSYQHIITKLLENACSTLEEIQFSGLDTHFFNQVIEICPNIKKLFFSSFLKELTIYNFDGRKRSLSLLQLTDLRIYTTKNISNQNVESILRHAVNLEHLMIGHCGSNVLSVLLKQRLQHNNKKLRRIFINPEDACFITNYDKYRPSRRFYRETIDVHLCENVTAGLLLPLLNDMIDHIKGFALTVTPGGRESHWKDWTCFSNFGSPSIRCMNIGFTSATESIFASVIRNCPSLEMIEFHHGAKPTSIIYNALQSLPTLHTFTINNEKTYNTLRNSVNSRDLLNFFTHYASLGDQSTLDEIRLCHIDDLDLVTLLEMTEIETLKEVELCDINTPHNLPLDHPIQALKNLSLLERIVIKMGYREVTDVGIQQLDCKTIELSSLEYITTEGVSNLIKNSSKLKELRVFNCANNNIRTDIIQTLAEDKNIVFSS